MLPVECVVRGYLSGSGWKDYQRTGTVSGLELPSGLRESDRLPEPIYTPSTKADEGHDEAIDFEATVELVGDRALAERAARRLARRLRRDRRPRARARRDPRRHEVRVRPRRRRRRSSSATRSARRTPRASGPPTSTSRAARRPRSTSSTSATGRRAPAGTRRRRRRRSPTTSSRRRASATCAPTSCWRASRSRPGSSGWARSEGARPDPAEGGHPRPPGPDGRARAAGAGVRGRGNVHVGRLVELDVEDPSRLPEMCERLLTNPLIEDYEIEMPIGVSGTRGRRPAGSSEDRRRPLPRLL